MKKLDMKNYAKLTNKSLFSHSYVYIDNADHVSVALFQKYKVRVKVVQEMENPDEVYRYIICKVRKKDEGNFFAALGELTRMLLVRGNVDYPTACGEMLDLFEE